MRKRVTDEQIKSVLAMYYLHKIKVKDISELLKINNATVSCYICGYSKVHLLEQFVAEHPDNKKAKDRLEKALTKLSEEDGAKDKPVLTEDNQLALLLQDLPANLEDIIYKAVSKALKDQLSK